MTPPKGRSGKALSYLPLAATEYRRQVAYYKGKAPGLDKLFSSSIKDAERLVLSNPEGFPRIDGETEIRAIIVRNFPFRLLYALRANCVLVLAVAHTAREPGQFLRRS